MVKWYLNSVGFGLGLEEVSLLRPIADGEPRIVLKSFSN